MPKVALKNRNFFIDIGFEIPDRFVVGYAVVSISVLYFFSLERFKTACDDASMSVQAWCFGATGKTRYNRFCDFAMIIFLFDI